MTGDGLGAKFREQLVRWLIDTRGDEEICEKAAAIARAHFASELAARDAEIARLRDAIPYESEVELAEIIKTLRAEQAEDRAALSEATELIAKTGSVKNRSVWWHETHAKALARAEGWR